MVRGQCQAETNKGRRCLNYSRPGQMTCSVHAHKLPLYNADHLPEPVYQRPRKVYEKNITWKLRSRGNVFVQLEQGINPGRMAPVEQLMRYTGWPECNQFTMIVQQTQDEIDMLYQQDSSSSSSSYFSSSPPSSPFTPPRRAGIPVPTRPAPGPSRWTRSPIPGPSRRPY